MAGLMKRLRVLFCRHGAAAVHLCTPPDGAPYMVICQRCQLVLYGEVTSEQAAVDDDAWFKEHAA